MKNFQGPTCGSEKNEYGTDSIIKKQVTLSVVIVNYRGWDTLKECLDSLSCLETATFQYEVEIGRASCRERV